jgi:hypothetical protein
LGRGFAFLEAATIIVVIVIRACRTTRSLMRWGLLREASAWRG